MTREEAIFQDYFWGEKIEKEVVNHTINKIYDDFESRTCENCKHSAKYQGLNSIYSCKKYITNRAIDPDYYTVESDFGCNKWEAKDAK